MDGSYQEQCMQWHSPLQESCSRYTLTDGFAVIQEALLSGLLMQNQVWKLLQSNPHLALYNCELTTHGATSHTQVCTELPRAQFHDHANI